MSKAVIFDIDDTLADWQGARSQGRKYFASAMEGTLDPIPAMIDLATEYHSQGVEVICLTARPAIMTQATLDWVSQHVGDWATVVITDSKDRMKDWEVKERLLATIDADIIGAYDDKAENIEMFEAHGIKATLV